LKELSITLQTERVCSNIHRSEQTQNKYVSHNYSQHLRHYLHLNSLILLASSPTQTLPCWSEAI